MNNKIECLLCFEKEADFSKVSEKMKREKSTSYNGFVMIIFGGIIRPCQIIKYYFSRRLKSPS